MPTEYLLWPQFQRAGPEHSAVAPDIVVIARRAEAATAVLCLQSFGSERMALPRGAAMHHDVVDFRMNDE